MLHRNLGSTFWFDQHKNLFNDTPIYYFDVFIVCSSFSKWLQSLVVRIWFKPWELVVSTFSPCNMSIYSCIHKENLLCKNRWSDRYTRYQVTQNISLANPQLRTTPPQGSPRSTALLHKIITRQVPKVCVYIYIYIYIYTIGTSSDITITARTITESQTCLVKA